MPSNKHLLCTSLKGYSIVFYLRPLVKTTEKWQLVLKASAHLLSKFSCTYALDTAAATSSYLRESLRISLDEDS